MEFTDFVVEFSEFWRELGEAQNRPPFVPRRGNWRMGQAMFNFLLANRPDLANKVRGTVADPFYLDDRIPSFLAWLEGEWNAAH